MRQFEADGVVGSIHPDLFTMPGVGTPVEKSRRMGELMAQEIKDAGIDACILVAT
jgi:glycine reductase